jgi:transposase
MHLRVFRQPNTSGEVRHYAQLVQSYRNEEGRPATRVLAHLGRVEPDSLDELRRAVEVLKGNAPDPSSGDVLFERNLAYLPLALVSHFFRKAGLHALLDELGPQGVDHGASLSQVVESLVLQRCVSPASKLALQRWLEGVAIEQVVGVERSLLNNTRVHWALAALSDCDKALQERIQAKVVAQGTPRVLYFDLTDTWFESGGGSLASRGQTKAGHRSKRKIHIALLVDEHGLPLRWQLLPGALNETTVLPTWLPWLKEHTALASAPLIFDRGMPSAANFQRLVGKEEGHLFLTSVKSDSIPTYVELDTAKLDELQGAANGGDGEALQRACDALELARHAELKGNTFVRDLGLVTPPKPASSRQVVPPPMQLALYFNADIQRTKRENREEKRAELQKFVNELNAALRVAKKSRGRDATMKKVTRELDRLKLSEIYTLSLEPIEVQGKTKKLTSFEVRLGVREDMLRHASRYDGLTLLVAHPELKLSAVEKVEAYRQKDVIESDFRVIKSVLELRPVHHRSDSKIAAHVTVCVLALLVERQIEQRLKASKNPEAPRTCAALIEQLGAVSLARLKVGRTHQLIRTEADDEIVSLLTELDVRSLLDAFPSRLGATKNTA